PEVQIAFVRDAFRLVLHVRFVVVAAADDPLCLRVFLDDHLREYVDARRPALVLADHDLQFAVDRLALAHAGDLVAALSPQWNRSAVWPNARNAEPDAHNLTFSPIIGRGKIYRIRFWRSQKSPIQKSYQANMGRMLIASSPPDSSCPIPER